MLTCSSSDSSKVLIVDPTGEGEFLSIEAALKQALPHDYILLQAGRYQESFIITFPVTIAGDVQSDGVVEIDGSVAINCSQPESIVMRDLTIAMPSNFSYPLPALFTDQTMEFLPSSSSSVAELQNSEDGQTTDLQGVALLILSGTVCLERCKIQGGRGTGIQLWDVQSKLLASDCHLLHSDVGLRVEASAEAKLENCRIHQMERLGLWSGRGTTLQITRSIVSNGIGAGMILEGCRSVLIEACEVFDWSRSGLVAREVLSLNIIKTKIYENSQNGICLSKRSQCYIRDSQFTANSWHNIAILDNVYAELTNCHIAESLQIGIAIAQDSRVRLKKSNLEGNLKSGLSVRTKSTATLEYCSVINHSGVAIEIGSQSTVTLDRTQVLKNGLCQHQAAILHQENGSLSIKHSKINQNYVAIDRAGSAVTMIRFSRMSQNRYGVWMNFDPAQHRSNLSLFMVYPRLNLLVPQSPPKLSHNPPLESSSQSPVATASLLSVQQFIMLASGFFFLCFWLAPLFNPLSGQRMVDREKEAQTLQQEIEQRERDRQAQLAETDRIARENKARTDELDRMKGLLEKQMEQQKRDAETEKNSKILTIPTVPSVELPMSPPEPSIDQPEPARLVIPNSSSRKTSIPTPLSPSEPSRSNNPMSQPIKKEPRSNVQIPPTSIPLPSSLSKPLPSPTQNSNPEVVGDADNDPSPPQ